MRIFWGAHPVYIQIVVLKDLIFVKIKTKIKVGLMILHIQ